MATEASNRLFQYPNLDITAKQIRLLKLLPDRTDNRLSFTLECHDVTSTSFVALSYTWDHFQPADQTTSELFEVVKEEPLGIVLVENQQFWITPSLLLFIEAIAATKLRDRFFFVDQICIDQSNEKQKAHQVALMKDVYFNAEEVIAWIVPLIEVPKDDTLKVLSEKCERHKLSNSPKFVSMLQRTVFKRHVKRCADHLFVHLISAYWSRHWIVQEILLAKELSFQAGEFSFDWRVLAKVLVSKRSKPVVSYISDWDAGVETSRIPIYYSPNYCAKPAKMPYDFGLIERCENVLSYKQQSRNKAGRYEPQSIDFVLNRLAHRNCSMLRDRIFGLLGLVNSDIRVDYGISLSKLYLVVLLESFVEFPGKDSIRKARDIRMATFIYQATLVCGLDVRSPTTVLVTTRLLCHFKRACEDVDQIIHEAWCMREYDLRRDEGLKIIATKYKQLQQEIRECKVSRSEMNIRNWDDFKRVPLTESHTYDEWLQIVDDLIPDSRVYEWHY